MYRDQILADISNDYEKTAGYLVYDFSAAVGQEMDAQAQEIAAARLKFDFNNLTGAELDMYVNQRKGLTRKAATYAVGYVTVNGNGTVSAGDLFETANGVQFRASAAVTVSGSANVPIIAVIAGNSGNVGANSITQMPITISGIVSCNNDEATLGGYDEEADDALRARYLVALRTPTTSGNKAAYKGWALEVAGVGNAQVFPLGHGANTVDVVIINDAMQPADSSLVAQVQQYIDPNSSGRGEGAAPMGAYAYVSSATALNINVSATLTITDEQSKVKAKVEAAIIEYLASIAFTGANVSYAQILNAIIDVPEVIDVTNYKVNNGTANIAVPDRKVAVFNSGTWAYA